VLSRIWNFIRNRSHEPLPISYPGHWKQYGIEGESGFRSLTYSVPAKVVIVEFFRKIPEGHGLRSLYARKGEGQHYARLSEYSDVNSYGKPVTCHTSPIAYSLVTEWTQNSSGGTGGNDIEIAVFDLNERAKISSIKSSSLMLKDSNTKPWLSELLGVLPGSGNLLCKLGIPEEPVEHEPPIDDERELGISWSQHVSYWICEVNPQSAEVTRIQKLRGGLL
jgi:hypothetical protein